MSGTRILGQSLGQLTTLVAYIRVTQPALHRERHRSKPLHFVASCLSVWQAAHPGETSPPAGGLPFCPSTPEDRDMAIELMIGGTAFIG